MISNLIVIYQIVIVFFAIMAEVSNGCLDKFDCFANTKKGRLQGNILKTVNGFGYSYCYMQCTGLSNCSSFNYNYYNGICELKTVVAGPGDTLTNEEGFIYSPVPSALPGNHACAKTNCASNQICYPLTSGGHMCLSGCTSPPSVSHAIMQSTLTGSWFNIGTQVTYSCTGDYELQGTSESRCLSSGAWSGGVHCEEDD